MSNPPPVLRPDYQMMAPMDEGAPPASSLNAKRFVATLQKRWWIPVVTLILSGGGVAGYLLVKPPTFVSRSHMWETVKLRLAGGDMFTEDVQNFVGTQAELLKSSPLRDLALKRLKATSTNAVPLNEHGEELPVAIRVTPAAKSSVFMIEATCSDQVFVRAYLNALMNEYLEYKKNIRKTVSGETLASITEQVERLERDLKEEQDKLTAFQRTNNLAILQEEGTIAGGYLAKLKTQLSDFQLEEQLLKASARDLNLPAATGSNSLPGVVEGGSAAVSSERSQAFKEVELLKLQRAKLSKYLRPKHPKIVKLDAEIERSQRLIEIYQRQDREQLSASQQNVRMRIANILASIKEWESKVVEANARIAEAERLKLNVQRVQSVYDRLNVMVQNVGISRNIDQETLSILEPATVARRSYSEEISAATMGGLGGLGLGLGIIALLTLRDDRFNSLMELSEKLGDAVVGQVPEAPKTLPDKQVQLLETGDDRQMYAESYRNLRSAILFMATEKVRPKLLLITSAVPNEGKSTIAANLARTMAMGGSRVLLVDADLRKGYLHELLGLQREPGLAELLQRPDQLDAVVQSNSLSNFFFLARGQSVGNPGDLFLSRNLDQLFARFRGQFDYILVDSCPVFAADDATTLAPKADGVLFVVRSRFSRAAPVREALELLYQRQARILGLVFNRADSSARTYYYYKHADYYPAAKTA